MAKYTNIAVALGNQSGNGSSKTFTFSASSINSLVNNTLPSECKITRAVIQFRGAKPYSFSGKGSITITLGSYSKSYSDVIANDGGNDDFGSGDTLCTSDDIKGYINSNGRFNSDLIFKLGSSTLSTYWRVEATIYFDYETPITVSVGCGAGGTISSTGGSYYTGTTFTVTATPNSGYRFVGWANTSGTVTTTANPYSFTVNGNTTFSAVFRPIYITYDSIFSFKMWADNYLKSWTLMNISNITDIGFTGEALADDAYTENSQPLMSVTAGKSYTVDFQAYYPPGFQLFVFFTDANGIWDGSLTNLKVESNTTSFSFIPTTNYISIRVDIDGTGNINTFSNFRIYPADCPYMSNSVTAAERTGRSGQAMPTPTREGYTFKGWNTKPDGSGTTYTSSSAFPSNDLVLYSQWEEVKPEIKNIQMIYLDKQISSTNKVPCGEGFVISVELS